MSASAVALAATLSLACDAGGSFAVAASSSAAGSSGQADHFASAPARATVSTARLVAGGPPTEGIYRAGVEIDLDPKTITYWRSPGEAGAPPEFDFSASTNVASVEVVYPAPKRIEEQGVFVAGYDTRVMFPLKVKPRDPKAPVTLSLSLNYSACGKICLPARASLSLPLPQSGRSPYAEALADADRRAPQRLDATQATEAIALERSASDSWRLTWRGQGKPDAVFVEVPDPLYVESLPHDGAFDLKLYATGAKPASLAATVTVVTDRGAYEAPVSLR